MTAAAPLWMASPPELHSALLSTGAGPGPLLASAAAWTALSTEYTEAADELIGVLGTVQAGAWQGPSGESYVAAHAPYLAWLNQASAGSAATAAQCEMAAGAYVSALAAMPSLPELAANHATHGVLVATNFFGINTIPIALNEADYARMWVQAAATMSTYQAVSDAAVASVPQTPPAPQIVKSDSAQPADDDSGGDDDNPLGLPQWLVDALQKLGIGNSQLAHDPTINTPLDQVIAHLLQNFGYNWDPAGGTLNGFDYDYYSSPAQLSFWVARALELLEDFQYFGQLLTQNPVQAIQWFISWQLFDFPTHILEVAQFLAQSPALFAALTVPAVAPLGAVGGLAGLAGLAALPQPVPVPILTVPDLVPAFGASTTPAVPPAPAPAPAPATGGVGGPPPAPPAPGGSVATPFFPPYLLGPPGIGTGSGMPAAAGASRKASEPRGSAAAAAVAAAERDQQRARRRRTKLRRPDDAVMDLNVEVTPDWGDPADPTATASSHGAAGFAGTVTRGGTPAAGLTVSAGSAFNDAPHMPLLPGGWPNEKG